MSRSYYEQFTPSSDPVLLPACVSPRVLVRARSTGAFLSREGSWLRDITRAQAFAGALAIFDVKQSIPFPDAEVYYWFGECGATKWDFAVPI